MVSVVLSGAAGTHEQPRLTFAFMVNDTVQPPVGDQHGPCIGHNAGDFFQVATTTAVCEVYSYWEAYTKPAATAAAATAAAATASTEANALTTTTSLHQKWFVDIDLQSKVQL